MPSHRPHTVAALVYQGVATFELAVVGEVFGLPYAELGDESYRFIACAAEPPPLRTSVGYTIDTPYGLADLAAADTVVIPGWRETETPGEVILEAVRTAYARGARVISVCTGAFVLAAAGILDGRRATPHWGHAAELARRYPAVDVDPRVLYVDDGQVLTSAGTAAGIDLCLHVVRLDHGAAVANAIARRMVVPPHRDGGQAQYIEAPMAPPCEDDVLAESLAWMLENLGEPLTVNGLAARLHWSPRTFARRFRAATGTTPHQWLQAQRVLHAQRLLETTDQPVETIAARAGFGSAANLRQHFTQAVGTSPSAYRRTFLNRGCELKAS